MIKKFLPFVVIILLIITNVTSIIGAPNYFDDTTPPITTISTDPPEPVGNGWYPPITEVTLNAIDNESGVNVTYYQINNGGWLVYTQPFYLGECGIIAFQFYSVDNAGNVEDTQQVEIKVDCTGPITYSFLNPPVPNGLNDWYVTNVTLTLNATDNESGVELIFCSASQGGIYTEPVLISEDGCHDISYGSMDKAGNEDTPHKIITLYIDKTKPTMRMDYEVAGNRIKGFTFTFTATATDGLSGMDRVEFYFNNVLQKTVIGFGPTYQWTFLWTIIPFYVIKSVGYDIAGNNAYVEIEDPTPHSNQKTILPQSSAKINLKNFFLLRYFSSLFSSFYYKGCLRL